MGLGQGFIWAAFLASLCALVAFGVAFRRGGRGAGHLTGAGFDDPGRTVPWLRLARSAHLLALLAMVGGVAVLMRLLLTHQFQFTYVYRYSSRDLPLHYLISSFWAGQEGTFLLWATFTGLLGLVVSRVVRQFESGVMLFIMVVQCFLLLILIRLSPFALYPSIPSDGAGLNPLLQDPWMVIHPPLLFLGFAATAVPAAFALQALVRGDTHDWVRGALPWSAFTVLILGTPICLGGYWAYKVLGWGGYWGWDPVENGSLVPWLFSVTLLHGLVVQGRKGHMRRLNLLLAISCFALVLYSTFLTRSGVLGDFSVHSFVDLGINGFLIAFLLSYVALAFGLYAWRVRAIVEPEFSPGVLGREYGMFLGSLSILVFALIVLLGTSAPLFTRLGGTPSNVALAYYEVTSIPFGILLCLGLAVVPLLLWGRNPGKGLFRRLLAPLVLGALAAALLYLVGVKQQHHLALVFCAALAFFVNLEILIGIAGRNLRSAGGYLAHAGVAVMITGIITSTVYSRSEPILLPRGESVAAMGYRLTWSGVRPIDDGRKQAYDIQVTPARGREFTVSPVMFFSDYNGAVMRRPGIRRFLEHDLYLSPQGIERERVIDKLATQQVTLTAGQETTLGALRLKFVAPEPRTISEQRIEIAAVLEATLAGQSERATPVVVTSGEGQSFLEARLSDGTKIILRRFEPRSGRGLFYIRTPESAHYDQPTEVMILDVAEKPWINALWLGTFMVMGGLVLSVLNRWRLAARGAAGSGTAEAPGEFSTAPAPPVAGEGPPVPAKAASSAGQT